MLAGRCPYCRDENQGVYGRIILLLLLLAGIVFLAYQKSYILDLIKDKPVTIKENKLNQEVIEFEKKVEQLIKRKELSNIY
jgi:hypothetical protein